MRGADARAAQSEIQLVKDSREFLSRLMLPAACLALAGCSAGDSSTGGQAAPALRLDAPSITAMLPDVPQGAVLWLHPGDPARPLFIGAAGQGGLVLHELSGAALPGGVPALDADFVAISYGFGSGGSLLVAHDRGSSSLRLFTIDPVARSLRALNAQPLALETEATGLCLYRSAASGRHYAFVAGGDGILQQWEIHAGDDRVTGRRVRSLALGTGIAGCAVDEADAAVYVADESVGIWRLNAEPESDDGDRRLIDRTGAHGSAGEEVNGLAVYDGLLLALLNEGAALNGYRLPQGELAGTLAPQTGTAEDSLGELEDIWAGYAGDRALLLFPDGQAAAGGGWRIADWSILADALKLDGTAAVDPRQPAPPTARIALPSVETQPVDDYGDAADDIAIWVHPRDPARSLIIGAQKKRGIEVYDLSGRRLQMLPDGRMNNVDLRQGVNLGGGSLDIVAASDRTNQRLALYAVDGATGRLRDIAASPVPTGMRDPYGLCMYVSARDGAAYVFVNNSDRGEFKQWRLTDEGGRVAASVVREFVVGSQAEGCVADDATGALYIAEEDAGLWRYSAEPDGGDTRRQIDSTTGGRLTADAEGLAIFHGPGDTGYLVLSNQGADNYALYRREGDNEFIGVFQVGANDALGIDGASETDGLEVTSRPLGPDFPHGLLVVQDGRNITPLERQNFKLVPWQNVEHALGLR
jgi:3-phytase